MEEFWGMEVGPRVKASELIMDLLIDVTGRSELMDTLNRIDPDYGKYLLQTKEAYKQAFLQI